MGLNQIVNLTITADTRGISRAAFGTPLVAAYHTAWVNRVKEYSDPDEMLDDGFTVDDPAYDVAVKMWAQKPHPSTFKVGRRALPFTQTFNLRPINTTDDFTYLFELGAYEIEYTVDSDNVADICDVLHAAIDATNATEESAAQTFNLDDGMTLTFTQGATVFSAVFNTADFVDINAATAAEVRTVLGTDWNGVGEPTIGGTTTVTITSAGEPGGADTFTLGGTALAALGLTAGPHTGTGIEFLQSVDNTTHVTVTATQGKLVPLDLGLMDPLTDLAYDDNTPDPGIATDLAAIAAEDDNWYGLALDSNSPAEIEEAAAYIEAQRKQFYLNSSQSDIVDSTVSTDLFSSMQDDVLARSIGLYSRSNVLNWSGAAWMSRMFSTDPGRATNAFKTLQSVTVDNLGTSKEAQVQAKGGNHYTAVAGRAITFEGKAFDGSFVDLSRFIDYLHARVTENVFAVLASNDFVPFTNQGINMIGTAIKTTLLAEQSTEKEPKGLSNDPEFPITVTVPRSADVPSADRGNRRLPDVTFQCTTSGAIHGVTIKGRVSV